MEHGLQARCFSRWRLLSALHSLALEKKFSEYKRKEYFKVHAVMVDQFYAWWNLINEFSSDESVGFAQGTFTITIPRGHSHVDTDTED
jgi:hypothetical protein